MKICAVDGCQRAVDSHGYCPAHASRFRRHGHPLKGRVTPGEPRKFLDEVASRHEGDECLVWPFNRARGGYACIRAGDKLVFVSHLHCTERYGPKPTPLHEAAHSCGNGHLGCVHPGHVRWATHSENCDDKAAHGTLPVGSANPFAKLTENDARAIMALKGAASARIIAEQFHISRETVSHIHNRRKWAHLFTE